MIIYVYIISNYIYIYIYTNLELHPNMHSLCEMNIVFDEYRWEEGHPHDVWFRNSQTNSPSSAWLRNLHPKNSTWNLKMMVSKKNLLFQGDIFRFHVKLQGCNWCFFQETASAVDEVSAVDDFSPTASDLEHQLSEKSGAICASFGVHFLWIISKNKMKLIPSSKHLASLFGSMQQHCCTN